MYPRALICTSNDEKVGEDEDEEAPADPVEDERVFSPGGLEGEHREAVHPGRQHAHTRDLRQVFYFI